MKLRVLTEEQKALAAANVKLVQFVILRIYGRDMADDEDMVSVGNIGLCNAAATYNPSLGLKFSTYAAKCIVNEIGHVLRMNSYPKRNPEEPVASLNYKAYIDDDEACELIDFVTDEFAEDIAEAVTDHIMCEKAMPLVPTFIGMMTTDMSITDYAKSIGVSRGGLYKKRDDELRRARIALESHVLYRKLA